MRSIRLDESQVGIKIARRNNNNLRYSDDTTLMAESEELKSFLIKVKEENEKWVVLESYTRPPYLPLEKPICRKQQLELDMEQQTGSKSGKEYVKAVF